MIVSGSPTQAFGEDVLDIFLSKGKITQRLFDLVLLHAISIRESGNLSAYWLISFLPSYLDNILPILSGGDAMPNCEVLTKPVNFDALSHSIRQLLDEPVER